MNCDPLWDNLSFLFVGTSKNNVDNTYAEHVRREGVISYVSVIVIGSIPNPSFEAFILNFCFVTGKRNHWVLLEGAWRWRDWPCSTLDSLLFSPGCHQANQPLHKPTSNPQTCHHAKCFCLSAQWEQGQHISGQQAWQCYDPSRQPHRNLGCYSWRSVHCRNGSTLGRLTSQLALWKHCTQVAVSVSFVS